MNDCHVIPNQNIKTIIPKYNIYSFDVRSKGMVLLIVVDNPKRTFIQLLKKKVGPNRYKNGINNTHKIGKKSNKKLKNKTSAIKKIEPGNPKKTKQFNKLIRNNLEHKKLIPEISVIRRVLKRLLIASTKKNEFDDSRA